MLMKEYQKDPEMSNADLGALCELLGAKDRELAAVVKRRYPGHDRALFCKAKAPEKYGIALLPEALALIGEAYGLGVLQPEPVPEPQPPPEPMPEPEPEPEPAAPVKATRHGMHRLTRSVSCRLTDEQFEELTGYLREDGFGTVQDFVSAQVRNYLIRKRTAKGAKYEKT